MLSTTCKWAALDRGRPWLGFLRTASSAAGGSSGSSGASAKDRAVQYLREKERQEVTQREKPSSVASSTTSSTTSTSTSSSSRSRSRLAEAAEEWTECQQAMFLSSPSGLGVGAEAAIAAAIADGALDNLAGKGKPLKQEDHSAQFYRVDPLVQAVTRTMGVQGVRPLSLDLKEELQRCLEQLQRQLQTELRRALATGQQPGSGGSSSTWGSSEQEPQSSSNGGGGSSSATGWLGRWFGGTSGRGASASSTGPASITTHTLDSIRAGQHPGLQHAAEEAGKLIKQYNTAVLADKETFGAHWPLDTRRALEWGAEVEAALAAIHSAGPAANGRQARRR